jgi:ABC-type phosphate transport system auxiliary subunit
MAKKQTEESDEIRLKKRIASRAKDGEQLSGDPAARTLRKRLKRVQRKRRALSLRMKRAAGKQAEAKA